MKTLRAVLLAMPLLLMATNCPADVGIMLDFSGQLYEADNTPGMQGFPPSNPGDILAGVGFVEDINPLLPWNPLAAEYTLVLADLVSDGQVEITTGVWAITYTGGNLYVVADDYDGGAFTAASYGVDPPNATAPSTFMDGDVYLVGDFDSFTLMFVDATATGQFEGVLYWTGGSQLGAEYIDTAQGYVLSGVAEVLASPEGYDLQMVGHISFDPEIPTEGNTWSGVKNVYR